MIPAVILGLFGLFTICTQKNELKFYIHSYQYLQKRDYQNAWREFDKAFWYNPVCKLSRMTSRSIKKLFAGTEKTPPIERYYSPTLPQRNSLIQYPQAQQRFNSRTYSSNSGGAIFRILLFLALIIGAGIGILFFIFRRETSRLVDDDKQAEEKVYCKICQGVHREGDVFCPEKGRAVSQDVAGSFFQRPARYEFKYKWRIKNQEFTGELECEDEEDLRRHLEAHRGELVEVLEKTKVLTKILGGSPAKPALSQVSNPAHHFDSKQDEERKKCPYCSEDIKAEAVRCKHCNSVLVNQNHASDTSRKIEGLLGIVALVVTFGPELVGPVLVVFLPLLLFVGFICAILEMVFGNKTFGAVVILIQAVYVLILVMTASYNVINFFSLLFGQ